MAPQPPKPTRLPASTSLPEHLHAAAEALLGARTAGAVLDTLLGHALGALGTGTGTALLVDPSGERLEPVVTRGPGPGIPALSLTERVPVTQALHAREPLFTGSEEGLAGSPEPAAAVLPLVLGGRPIGALVLAGLRGLDAAERVFLRTLAAQGALALGRVLPEGRPPAPVQVGETRRLEEEHSALEAFAAFTEAVGTETDVPSLARHAIAVLMARFPHGSVGYYEREGNLWKGRVGSGNSPENLQGVIVAGLPGDTPALARMLRAGQAEFVESWDEAREGVPHSGVYGAVAFAPLALGGEIRSFLAVALRDTRWRARDRALVRAVARSLGLALERGEAARELERERAALAAFAHFTERVGDTGDVLTLSRHAAEVLLGALGVHSAVYFEREGDLWQARHTSGTVLPDLGAALERGVPTTVPSFALAAGRGEATFFEDHHAGGAEPEGRAVACYPLFPGDRPDGMLGMAKVGSPQWSERERAVFRAVGDSFRLALERTATARQLLGQKDELARRNRVLEAFADLARDLAFETDPYTLVRRAQEIVLALLPPGFSGYHEPAGGVWRLRSLVGDPQSAAVRAAFDGGLPLEETRSLFLPWQDGQPLYREGHDPNLDGQPELTRQYGAAATLPVRARGSVRGILAVGLFGVHTWTAADRAALETVAHNLGLALERAEGARELEDRTRALAAANEELEAFAYSVSHDLRTPVRHIGSFNDLLRRSLGDGLDERAARYLGIVDDATRRMNTLIDAMLDLSRTSRLPLHPGVVDLGDLVGAVRTELEADAQEREVEWQVAPLPLVMGDPGTLRQVLVNLLGNALKYTRPREVATIEVWAEDRPGEWAVFVRDNGVGFDPRYGAKLFGVFQRLHRSEEFEGTGVGLANVRRIVARHGGTVAAQGAPGAGATFSFTLPKPPAAG